MAIDVLEKIHKLIALAGSSNENEARTSAVIACKLITEHKVVLGLPGQEGKDKPKPQPAAAKPPKAHRPPKPPRARKPRAPRKPSRRRATSGYVVRAAEYSGLCRWCGIRVAVNETVVWAPRRYYHLRCAQTSKAAGVPLD